MWQTTDDYKIYKVLSKGCNAFLINKDDLYILFDCGPINTLNTLKKNLNKVLNGHKLDFLFFSHGHYDHVESANKVKEYFNCKIISTKNLVNYLKKGYGPLYSPNWRILKSNKIFNHFKNKETYEPINVDIVLKENQLSELCNMDIEVINTPGHCKYHNSLIINKEIALSGSIIYGSYPYVPPFVSDSEIVLSSWEKLLKTNCSIFLPAHKRELNRKTLLKYYNKYNK